MNARLALFAFLLLGTAGTGAAQQAPLSVRPHIGVFTPGLPLVAVADGYHPHVQLGGAPAVGLEFAYQLRPILAVYTGMSAVFTRLHHSGIMELREVDGPHSSRATLLTPTAGVLLSSRLGRLPVEPTLRVGLGTKLYYFDLHDVDGAVADLTGDLGLGFATHSGPVSMLAEARWMPSRFEANHLPIRTAGNERQSQSDWALQVGFRLAP